MKSFAIIFIWVKFQSKIHGGFGRGIACEKGAATQGKQSRVSLRITPIAAITRLSMESSLPIPPLSTRVPHNPI
jgi:hypothetical protein